MEIINVIYEECHSLGSALGFGTFEGGVIYFSVFSLIIFKCTDAVKGVFDKKKSDKNVEKKSEELVVKVEVVK